MTPLRPAEVTPASLKAAIAALIKRGLSMDEAQRLVARETENVAHYCNDVYHVVVRRLEKAGPDRDDMLHLSIKRLDRQPIHDWRDLQRIKSELVGPECEAVELYPAESRLVDSANQFHLWAVVNPRYRFPIGWKERFVSEDSIGYSQNRPFEKGQSS